MDAVTCLTERATAMKTIGIKRRAKRRIESEIIDFYRREPTLTKAKLSEPLAHVTLTNTGHGLGDTVILTDLPRAAKQAESSASVFSQAQYFRTLMSFNPYFEDSVLPFWVSAEQICLNFEVGNGHIIQRLRRAFGFSVDHKPMGCLVVEDVETVQGRVVLHFGPGPHVRWQREHVHPRAREIYPENMQEIQRFVQTQPALEFIEIGDTFSGLRNVQNYCGLKLKETIRLLASAEYFIGIISGPLHLSAALGLKIINVINFPAPNRIFLPTLKDIGQVESEWFYPQSVLLHQDGEGGTVYGFSSVSLERAISGELYPYWSDRYLSLVDEEI